MFPIQAIEEFKPRDDDNQPPMPMPNLEDDEEWEIEEVKDRATIKGTNTLPSEMGRMAYRV